MKGVPFKTKTTFGRAATHARAALACAALLLALSALPTPPARAQSQQVTPAHPDAEVERGRQLYLRGDNAAAVKVLDKAAKRLKTDAAAWFNLGLALTRAEKHKDARKAFERVVKLLPDSAIARVALAFGFLRVYNSRDAEREARRALELDPKLAEAHFAVGVARFREEKFEQAVEQADEALRVNPAFGPAQYLKGEALLNIYADASGRAMERYPLSPDAPPSQRAATLKAREAVLAPVMERLREAADRMETFITSQPGSSDEGDWRDQVGTLRVYGRAARKDVAGDPGVLSTDDTTRKAVIIDKPPPDYTDEARRDCVSGVVRVRAVLSGDGTVKHIIPVRRLSHGLTEESMRAARAIKFQPAVKDGKPVSQFVVLEYTFNCR